MAFPLVPTNGQSYADSSTGRKWSYSSTYDGWVPNETNYLDELDDVTTLSNITKDPLTTILNSQSGANPVSVDITSTTYAAPRQSFYLQDYVEVQDITVALDYAAAGTSGLLRMDIYKGENLTTNINSTNLSSVQASLDGPVLASWYIEAVTAQGAAVFTFPEGNILAPGTAYTFIITSINLDGQMFLTTLDSTVDGQFGNTVGKDISFFLQGKVLTGTPSASDVLKYDKDGGGSWVSGSAYPSGAYVPFNIDITDPTVSDTQNAGTFWQNAVTKKCWISAGSGTWIKLPPDPKLSVSPAVATRSDTAPTSPYDGQLWFADPLAKLFLYDEDAGAWIEI